MPAPFHAQFDRHGPVSLSDPDEASPEEPTLRTLLSQLRDFGDRPALGLRQEFGVRWWSYNRLHRESLRAAAVLRAAGVASGDRVLLGAANSPEWAAFFLGATACGAVVVPVDQGSPADLLDRIAEQVGASLAIAGSEQDVPARLSRVDVDALREKGELGGWEVRLGDVRPEDPAIIFFTSGTTSTPRGVVLTHRNLLSQCQRFRSWLWLTRRIPFRLMVVAPLSHSQGIMVGLCIPLTIGLSVIYTHRYDPGHVIRTLRDNRVTLLSTVPRALTMLTKAFEQRPYGRTGTRLGDLIARTHGRFLRRHRRFNATRAVLGYRFWIIFVGGAKVSQTDETFWRGTGCLLVQGYGLTETAALVSVNPPVFGAVGSVGKPLGHFDVRLAEDGEILVRGPSVTPGYLGAKSGEGFTDGYLRTGDIGRMDKYRRLFFEGRKKDVIVTSEGFNVYAGDLEAALTRQPGVRDAVVCGREEEGRVELHAALLLEPGSDAGGVVRRANTLLQSHQRIRGWTVWPEADFPRGALLKARREEVARRVASAFDTPSPREVPRSPAEIAGIGDRGERLQMLARWVARGSGSGSGELRLVEDLGLSSLDVVELLFLLETESEAYLENVVLEQEATLGELQRLVAEPSARAAVDRFHARNPPRWAELALLRRLRRLVSPVMLRGWMAARARLEVRGREFLSGLEPPVLFAGIGHEHGSDVLAIYSALPSRFRDLAVVASRWIFTHYLRPGIEASWRDRLAVALAFNAAIPLFFPLALTPQFGTTREGLMEACRLVDRGFSLIIFEGRGTALIAEQCGVPIVPTRLSGNAGLGFVPGRRRGRIGVAFEAPLKVGKRGWRSVGAELERSFPDES